MTIYKMYKKYKKILFVFILLLILSGQCFAEEKMNVAVLYFKRNGVSANEMKTVIELLSISLFNKKEFNVMDVDDWVQRLKDEDIDLEDCYDKNCLLDAGSTLLLDAVILGSFVRLGSKYILSARLVYVKNGYILSSVYGIYESIDSVLMDIGYMTNKLVEITALD